MSHFTVLVIGDNWEEQLAPFQENNMGDCPKEYMEFVDTEEESRQRYNADVRCMGRDKYGNLYDLPDEKQPNVPIEEYLRSKGQELAEVSQKDLGVSFEEWSEDHNLLDEETGKHGYWHNPNAKWDWYVLGGRWSGLLRIRPDAAKESNRAYALDAEPGEDDLQVDQCRKGDLDLEGLTRYREEEARKLWARAEEESPVYPDMPEEAYKKAMHKRWELGLRPESTLEDLLDEARTPFCTYAVLKDGIWYERGAMGWFGLATNEMPEDQWQREFTKLLQELPDDTLISVVDCHI